MRSKMFTAALGIGAVSVAATMSAAQSFNAADRYYQVTFDDLSFAGAQRHTQQVMYTSHGLSTPITANIVVTPSPQWMVFGSASASVQGSASVSSFLPDYGPPGSSIIHMQLLHQQGQAATTVQYSVYPLAGSASFQRYQEGEQWVLGMRMIPNGSFVTGSPFIWELRLPGDWSSRGLATGQLNVRELTLGPQVSVIQNFVFNGQETVFRAEGFTQAGNVLDIELRGIPAPSGAAAIACGLLLMARRRRG